MFQKYINFTAKIYEWILFNGEEENFNMHRYIADALCKHGKEV